ncbi:ribosomal protein S5 domain 2-type protein [Gorgonomyces haynaldii]|nr:ribosomal protein S5 domain 2-type protein [Gorgonomyces haynaldii]
MSREEFCEELEAIEAIFPDLIAGRSDRELELVFSLERGQAMLHISFPVEYPNEMPSFRLSLPRLSIKSADSIAIEKAVLETVQHKFTELFQPGYVVLMDWIGWIQEYLSEQYHIDETEENVEEVVVESVTVDCPHIWHSEPMTEKKSIFVAHAAIVRSIEEVVAVRKTLLLDRKIASATHNITAYRIVSGTTVIKDCDDDGEDAAGARLLHLLELTHAQNIFIMVSRWYGGILLGPKRFKLINNCARALLEDIKVIA